MGSLVKSIKSWLVICLAACLVAACAAFAAVQPVQAYADELTAGVFTQDLTLGARVMIVGVNGGQNISLEKGGSAKTFSVGGGTVVCEQEASGKIKITLNNATIGATDQKTGVRMQVMQDWSETASYPVELIVNGENTISSPSATSTLYNGITFSNTDNVTISGSGSLMFSSISTPLWWGKPSTKSGIDESGTLTINGPTIDASANTVGKRKTDLNSEKLSIVMKSGKLFCAKLAADSYVQSGGTVEAADSTAGLVSVDTNVFTMSGGTLTATSKYRDAISVMDSMKVAGGSISAKGSEYAIYIGTSGTASVKASCIKSVSGCLGKGVSFKVAGSAYKVTACDRKAKKFTVTLTNGANKSKLSVNTAKIGGITYKVTAIGKKALAKKSKLSTVVFGANVKKIGAQALSGSAKAKVLTVKSKALTAKNVKNSLKGSKVVTVKVPAGKVDAYTKIFAQKNSGKKVIVKAA